MEIIKDIGTVIGLILSAITLITLCCKPIRKRFVSWIRHTSKTDETVQWMQEFKEMLQNHIALDEKKQAQMDLISAAMLDLLRDDITRIYFQYIGKKDDEENQFLLKCEDCGDIMNMDCGHMKELYSHVLEEHHFNVNPHRTMFYGVCEKCLVKELGNPKSDDGGKQ